MGQGARASSRELVKMAQIGPDFLAISLVFKELCYYILYEFSRYDLNISYLASGGWNKLIFIV